MSLDIKKIKDTYNEKGYAFPIEVMSEEEALSIRDTIEENESKRGSMHYVVKPYILMPWILELAKRQSILDPVKAILGEDLLLWDCEFIIKEPGDKKIVEWHQDLMYFGLNSDDLVTAWLAISLVNQNSGCMQFLAGTHKKGLRKHRETHNPDSVLARGQELVDEIQVDNSVDVVLQPGQMSLHHGATYHASGENVSNDRRIALCLLYVKPSVKQTFDSWDSATLVSGVDKYHNFSYEDISDKEYAEQAVEFQKMVDKRRKLLWRTATPQLAVDA
ncbi:MAG: phytanoyl-CoA dioxygenase family protein [Candidatus Thiodiazotropha sp.]